MQSPVVLVTGASGFVGRHLCQALHDHGYRIRAVFIEPSPPQGWPKEIEWIKIEEIGPVTSWEAILDQHITHVVHLAAIAHRTHPKSQVDEATYDRINHLGTAQLAKAAARAPALQRFFFMSSIGAVASLSDREITEETPCCPDTAYGRSKLAAERAIEQILGRSPVDWCIFRPPLLYGPGNPGNMERLLKLLQLPFPLPLATVKNRRSFLYVGNLANAILLALEHPQAARKVFCISDGFDLSTPELIRELGRTMGRPVRLWPCPLTGLKWMGNLGSVFSSLTGRSIGVDRASLEKLCGSLIVNDSCFRQTCGWTPPYTLPEGLAATMRKSAPLGQG